MKNAKYLVAIAAFLTLALVGFSAFTAPSGHGTVAGSKQVFGVGSINAHSPEDLAGIKWFLTREEAVTQAQLWATNSQPLVYTIVEGYVNEAKASEAIPAYLRNW